MFCGALSVSVNPLNETAEFLWNLSNFALQSRQAHSQYPYPYSYKYPGKYPAYYQNYPTKTYGQYPGSNYIASYGNYPYPYKLHSQGHFSYKPASSYGYPSGSNPYPNIFQHLQKPKESIMEVLYSIARNDDLQCVPKLICEATSGTLSGRQQGLNLPINVNMESLLSFLSTLNGVQSSPLLYFGKAALLGFTSKGNTGTCNYAYPECPSDPDRVVKYLNNHNGGFFRFFNANPAQNFPQNYHQIPYRNKAIAEQRIQNNAVDYIPNHIRYQNGITFPKEDVSHFQDHHGFRSEKALKFPSNDFIYNNELNQDVSDFSFHSHSGLKFPSEENYEHFTRRPKELLYHNSDYNLDFQKPLPNHKVTPMIFPVRTGTGDLRLDPEELLDYQRPVSYVDEDVRIIFNGVNHDDRRNEYGRGFSFPP
ncbi:uncharacterized protein LOC108912809 [Anoplophora glabripennis]|uniref:uncharacterized protein LOC108912809 n=1 Tax=Anoplophora glabripennis TaxID=217634 RepID=UPI0008741000|nr:uncharacterized protein LOC108912809 [Anoplophora glabripennis]